MILEDLEMEMPGLKNSWDDIGCDIALRKLTTIGPDGLEPNLRDLRQEHVRRTQLGDSRR